MTGVTEPLTLTIPEALVEQIAEQAADIVLSRLASTSGLAASDWLSVSSAANYLDVAEERIRKLIARRQLPFYQEAAGCRILLRRCELDDWLISARQAPRP